MVSAEVPQKPGCTNRPDIFFVQAGLDDVRVPMHLQIRWHGINEVDGQVTSTTLLAQPHHHQHGGFVDPLHLHLQHLAIAFLNVILVDTQGVDPQDPRRVSVAKSPERALQVHRDIVVVVFQIYFGDPAWIAPSVGQRRVWRRMSLRYCCEGPLDLILELSGEEVQDPYFHTVWIQRLVFVCWKRLFDSRSCPQLAEAPFRTVGIVHLRSQ